MDGLNSIPTKLIKLCKIKDNTKKQSKGNSNYIYSVLEWEGQKASNRNYLKRELRKWGSVGRQYLIYNNWRLRTNIKRVSKIESRINKTIFTLDTYQNWGHQRKQDNYKINRMRKKNQQLMNSGKTVGFWY